MVRLLKTNGEIVENFTAETLKEKQDAVGGYIELVRCPDSSFLVVNEEGIYNALQLNEEASRIANMHILGDAIHLTDSDINTFLM
jgi:(2Fe-2S) ferredoxin